MNSYRILVEERVSPGRCPNMGVKVREDFTDEETILCLVALEEQCFLQRG